jgi:drug/metabolite transporter (DMT)-like permease
MTTTSQTEAQSNPIGAAIWMLGAIVAFSSMAISGRSVAAELDTFELMMYRSIIGIGLVVTFASLAGTMKDITTRSFGTHIIRNACHFAGQNLWFAALTMIPLAQVFALEFTSPIWVILLAPIFLGEKLTGRRILVALCGFVGILIVARPNMMQIEPGIVLGAIAAIGFAGSAIFTKILTRTEAITCILFWLTVIQAVFGIAFAGWDGDIAWPSAAIWPWVIAVSVAGLGAHFCLTKALTLAPAIIVMPFDFARLPIIAIIGAVVYNEALDPWVFLGAIIIFGANYLNLAASSRQKLT